MLRFSKYYKWFAFKCEENTKLEKYFYEFRLLEQTTTYPYFMDLMDLYENKKLTLNTVCQVLEFILQYYVRRSTIGLSTNAYRRFYPTLKTRIKTQDDLEYLNALYGVFASIQYRQRYPNNQEIKNELLHSPFYHLPSRLKKMVLEKLCNYKSKEKIVIDGNITIEHIMPQELTEKWKRELGGNWQDVYYTYVHTIGNLTLTGYNTEHRNKPFSDKKKLMKEYSNIPLNKYFEDIESWGETEIYNRCIHMIDLFNKVFPDISNRSEYRRTDGNYLSESQSNIWDLETESKSISLVSQYITKIYFDNKEYEILEKSGSNAVLVYILYELYVKNKNEFLNIEYTNKQNDFIELFETLFNKQIFKNYSIFYEFYKENNIYTIYVNDENNEKNTVFTTIETYVLCRKVLKNFKNQNIISGDIKLEYISK